MSVDGVDVTQQLAVLQQWVDTLVRRFPTAEIVDHDNNSFTIKIRYDDIFKYFYDDIKRSVPDAKVSLKDCEYDDKYKQCIVIKTASVITNFKEIGFDNVHVEMSDGTNIYYIPLQDMFNVFDTLWKNANRGKPVKLSFMTRSVTAKDGKTAIYHYVRIQFIQVGRR